MADHDAFAKKLPYKTTPLNFPGAHTTPFPPEGFDPMTASGGRKGRDATAGSSSGNGGASRSRPSAASRLQTSRRSQTRTAGMLLGTKSSREPSGLNVAHNFAGRLGPRSITQDESKRKNSGGVSGPRELHVPSSRSEY